MSETIDHDERMKKLQDAASEGLLDLWCCASACTEDETLTVQQADIERAKVDAYILALEREIAGWKRTVIDLTREKYTALAALDSIFGGQQ